VALSPRRLTLIRWAATVRHRQHDAAMRSYYAARASSMQYDRLSTANQRMLSAYAEFLEAEFAGCAVFEVACGTGYWTQVIAASAQQVLATDAVPEMLELARRRQYSRGNVEFLLSDAYSLAGVRGGWTAGFHFQWFSHVPKSRVAAFLKRFHAKLAPRSRVVFGDNIDQGSDPDAEGNFYQDRSYPGIADQRIIKNYPSESELEAALGPQAVDIRHVRFERDWFVSYELAR
jgi:SAM-dependent methyltransferase